MSSHREAPEISKDPVADSTDVYAFVSPDDPSTVTLIANYIPLEPPDAGPNFYEFGDGVLYTINIDNDGDGVANIVYQFTFTTHLRDPGYFLYNIGPITSLSQPELEPCPALQPPNGRRRPGQGHRVGHESSLPALQHRSAFDSELLRPGVGRDPFRRQRHQGLRGPTRRRLLRRPRLSVRPGQLATVPR